MIGLIPAAGSAQRWGGYIKELLPISDRKWLLDNCMDTLADLGCDRFIIVTNQEKIGLIYNHVYEHTGYETAFVMGGSEMWASIMNALPYCNGHDVVLSMPDTVVEIDLFRMNNATQFGLFETDNPGRYSVLLDGGFTKNGALPKGEYKAWGIAGWKAEVTHYWLSNEFHHFDLAFNAAIKQFDTFYYPIESYADMATYHDYAMYLGVHQ